MTPLTSKQRAHLRSIAHHHKALVRVGNEGVTDALLESVREALANREILKVKVLETAPVDAVAATEALTTGIQDAEVVQVIGRTVVLYRPLPEGPELRLP